MIVRHMGSVTVFPDARCGIYDFAIDGEGDDRTGDQLCALAAIDLLERALVQLREAAHGDMAPRDIPLRLS